MRDTGDFEDRARDLVDRLVHEEDRAAQRRRVDHVGEGEPRVVERQLERPAAVAVLGELAEKIRAELS